MKIVEEASPEELFDMLVKGFNIPSDVNRIVIDIDGSRVAGWRYRYRFADGSDVEMNVRMLP